MRRPRLVLSLSLLAVLAGGGVAYAGTTGAEPACGQQAGNVVAVGAVCPVNVDPDVQVAPIVNIPVIGDLQ